jgi:hypothetical protein
MSTGNAAPLPCRPLLLRRALRPARPGADSASGPGSQRVTAEVLRTTQKEQQVKNKRALSGPLVSFAWASVGLIGCTP